MRSSIRKLLLEHTDVQEICVQPPFIGPLSLLGSRFSGHRCCDAKSSIRDAESCHVQTFDRDLDSSTDSYDSENLETSDICLNYKTHEKKPPKDWDMN